jgi:hypothetical protein
LVHDSQSAEFPLFRRFQGKIFEKKKKNLKKKKKKEDDDDFILCNVN